MKTFKILFAAIIIAGFATTAVAQDVTTSAVIIAELETVKDTDLAFGGVIAGTNASMNPVNGETENVGVNDIDEVFGKIDITGLSGRNITVEFSGIDLTGPGTNNIAYTPLVSLGDDGDSVEGAAVTSLTPIALPADESFLYIGGTISPDINQVAGTYSGEMTVTIDYSSDI
jgi:hypothetical protein